MEGIFTHDERELLHRYNYDAVFHAKVHTFMVTCDDYDLIKVLSKVDKLIRAWETLA